MKKRIDFLCNDKNKKKPINIMLSVTDDEFVVDFRHPGSSEPITNVLISLGKEESQELKSTLVACGALSFEDEMDERIHFANVAR